MRRVAAAVVVRRTAALNMVAAATALLPLLVATPRAAAQEREGLRIGLRVGAYFPADAEVRRAFGDAIPVLGVAAAPGPRPGTTQIYPNIELIGARSGRDRFIVVPLTAVVEHHGHGSAGGANVPYLRADAGVAYFDYRVARGPATVVRARRGGAAGGAEVGMIFTRWLRASARYRLFQEMDGLNFGGAELGAVIGGVRLF